MNLTIQEIISVNIGLGKLLQGYTQVVGEGKTSSAVRVPYKFDDSTRWNIGKDKGLLEPIVALYQSERIRIIRELSPKAGDVGSESIEKQVEFDTRNKELLNRKEEVPGLLQLKKDSLLNGNPLDDALVLVLPIVNDQP